MRREPLENEVGAIYCKVISSLFPQSKPEGDRSQQLFLDVQKRGPRAFSGLVRCLVESGNGEAARVLDPSVVATAETRERPASLAYQSRNK